MRYVPLGSISTAVLLIAGAFSMVGAIVGAILIGPHNRLDFRHNAPLPLLGLGNSPVLQVELARNEDDLRAVLMVGDIQNNLRDARAGNLLDTFLFIPGYAGFLFVVGALLARTGSQLHCAALLLLALAAVCGYKKSVGLCYQPLTAADVTLLNGLLWAKDLTG